MVVVAQLVRASVCGTEGRGFEPHHPPQKKLSESQKAFFLQKPCISNCSRFTFLA